MLSQTKIDYLALVETFNADPMTDCCLCFDHKIINRDGESRECITVDGYKYHKSCYEQSLTQPLFKKILREAYELYPSSSFEHFTYSFFGEIESMVHEELLDYKLELDHAFLSIYGLYKEGVQVIKFPLDCLKSTEYEGIEFEQLRKFQNAFPNKF